MLRCEKMQVTNRQNSPRRIMALSKSEETSILAHHAIVIPMASIAVPAVTGYRGNSVMLGERRMLPHLIGSPALSSRPGNSGHQLGRMRPSKSGAVRVSD